MTAAAESVSTQARPADKRFVSGGRPYIEAIRESPVYDVAQRTSLDFAPLLSRRTGNSVWLKREDLQPGFSFKLRGAYAKMSALPRETLRRGVIAASAGNHAQGVALSARRLGCPALIVVPETTPEIKADAIRALGAELVVYGENYDDAYAQAQKVATERRLEFVHAYDDPDVIAGQGTIGIEILEDHEGDIDAIFVPVGGGGLSAGVALAVKSLDPRVKIFGVEPEDSDAMRRSIEAGERITLERAGALADGVAVRAVGEETFRICRELLDGIVVVDNDEICAAIKEIFEDRRAILEPSGALAFAGLKKVAERDSLVGKSLTAICSGANLDFDRLRYISERADIGQHREAIFAVHIPERPGAFRALCATLGHRAITEFNYRMGDPETATVFVGTRVAGVAEAGRLRATLEHAGYDAVDLTHDEIAKMHTRYMVGGRCPDANGERLIHFDFPERVGALTKFLDQLAGQWNISLFHYRNHGSDRGRVLAGFQVSPSTVQAFKGFLDGLGYPFCDATANASAKLFLGGE